MRSRRFFLGYQVADTADGVDLHLGAALGELLAQTMDVDLDRIGGDLAGEAENLILDQLLGHDPVLAPHQHLEHRGLARGQHMRLVVDKGLPAFSVERQVRDLQRASEQLAGPPQQRFQPRHQLLESERLDEIVVGTAAQAGDAVLQAAARRQHQDRDRILLVPDLAQDREAVAVGQAEIEDERRIAGRRYRRPGLGGRGEHIGFVALGAQTLGQQLRQLLVVLDHQQSHARRSGRCHMKSIPDRRIGGDHSAGASTAPSVAARGTRRENSRISTGSVTRMTIGASIMPPTTTTASGLCTCEPIPLDSAAGNRPTPAITHVISTGRICSSPVRRIAAVRSTPASIRALNCDRMMMPSIADIPNSAMKPIAAETLNGMSAMKRPNTPPRTAIGITLIASSVSGTEPKLTHSSSAMRPSVIGTTT